MNRSIKISFSGQQGQALALAIIVVAITGLLAVPVLQLSSSVLHRSAASRTTLHEQYSVDAGTEDAIWRIAYDNDFRNDFLEETPPTPYPITVNGTEIFIEVKPAGEPPVEAGGDPELDPGPAPLLWTTVEPSNINLLAPPEKLTVTIKIVDFGENQPLFEKLIEILPGGYVFNDESSLKCDGSSEVCTNLLWHPRVPENPVTTDDLRRTLSVDGLTIIEAEGANPWEIDPDTGKCATKKFPVEEELNQTMEWVWENPLDGPVTTRDKGVTAEISFEIELVPPIDLQTLTFSDSPWLSVTPNQCTASVSLHAGLPFELSSSFNALITATQGNTALDSLVQFVFPGPDIEIQSQRYGRREGP